MEKSIFSPDYEAVTRVLVRTRKASGMTQIDLANKLGRTQSSISKLERGALRLDIIQLRTVCSALKTTLGDFVHELEDEIAKTGRRRKASPERRRQRRRTS